MGDVAYIPEPVSCDFCKMTGEEVQAQYDGKTIHGPWGYMCDDHFKANGVGLGTGRGQRLIVGERPQPYTEDGDIEDILPTATESTKPVETPHNGIHTKTDWGF